MDEELQIAVLIMIAIFACIGALAWVLGEATALILGLFVNHGWGLMEKMTIGVAEAMILMLVLLREKD